MEAKQLPAMREMSLVNSLLLLLLLLHQFEDQIVEVEY